jgi:hypothetical protein
MRKRRSSPNEIEVRVWLLRRGLRIVDVAQRLEIQPASVIGWLQGRITSARIAEYFLHNGCPAEHVFPDSKASGAA